MKLKTILLAGFAAWIFVPAAMAQVSDNVVKIGVLTDMSGIYSQSTGQPVLEATKMAVEDFGGKALGKPVEVVSADHQNKADIGLAVARKWFDVDQVDVVVDVPNSAVALAVQEVAKEKNKMFIGGGAGTADLTGKACSPNGIQYVYDTYSMAATAARGAARIGKSFYFLTVDYAFGHALQDQVTKFLTGAGGKVVGSIRHPLGAQDLSSFVLQAQAAPADVIALASAGGDTINAIKTAKEFGITRTKKLLGLFLSDADIRGIGLETAQGMLIPAPFVWNRTPETIEWSRKFYKRTGVMPTFMQAGAYSYTTHYLKAIQAAGTDEPKAVIAKMKEIPVDDWFAKGKIREDGRMVHDMYLVQIKAPSESKEDWDYYKVVETVPGDQAFRPMSEGGCPLVAP